MRNTLDALTGPEMDLTSRTSGHARLTKPVPHRFYHVGLRYDAQALHGFLVRRFRSLLADATRTNGLPRCCSIPDVRTVALPRKAMMSRESEEQDTPPLNAHA